MIKRLANPTRWASIPVAALEDNRLSWKARGLLAFILAKPDDWEIRREQLIASSDHDGIRSVKGALKELVDLGYAELVTARSADGKHLAGQRYNVSDQAETFRLQNVSVTKRFGNKTAPVTYIPEETKDQEEDYRPKRTQNARAENGLSSETDLGKDHGCALYHPGFPCPHEQFALGEIARIVWGVTGQKRRSFKSCPQLHAYIHEHRDVVGPPDDWEIVAINHVRELAEWWKANRKPKDWSIPLMFSRPEETLANAQATQAPGGEPASRIPAGAQQLLAHLKQTGEIPNDA